MPSLLYFSFLSQFLSVPFFSFYDALRLIFSLSFSLNSFLFPPVLPLSYWISFPFSCSSSSPSSFPFLCLLSLPCFLSSFSFSVPYSLSIIFLDLPLLMHSSFFPFVVLLLSLRSPSLIPRTLLSSYVPLR